MLDYANAAPGEYQPGVCNIGPAEIRRRRRTGYVGLGAAVALDAVLLVLDAPAWTRLAVALPVVVGLSGLIQAQLRFCAGFGMAGLQNMGAIGEQQRVEVAEASAADRRKAMGINAVAIAGGLAVGVVLALLPA
jgi:hypothetical protein